MKRWLLVVALLVVECAQRASAWDYEGHRMVNLAAVASLPTNFPAFVTTPEARERIAFLSGEPDRWRNTHDRTLRHVNNPDHFFDMDLLPERGLSASALPIFRYDFTVAELKKNDGPPEPAKEADHTKGLIGFLPWTITEYHSKLRSCFSYLKTFQEGGGTAEEIKNAEQNIVYIMGVMGHFVGDAAQPLHTTKHYNGWIGANPNGFSTNHTIHQWIDGGYIQRSGINAEEIASSVRPAKIVAGAETNAFRLVVAWLAEQHKLVEPLYSLDKDGKLPGRQKPNSPEGRAFITKQLRVGAEMLGDLWLTAWESAQTDSYLKGQLTRRKEKQQ